MAEFNHSPKITLKKTYPIQVGWKSILAEFNEWKCLNKPVIIDCYHGVLLDDVLTKLHDSLKDCTIIDTRNCMHSSEYMQNLIFPDVTNDRIFGKITELELTDFFDPTRVEAVRKLINESSRPIFIIGPGATIVSDEWSKLVFADMARWEIQQRQRKGLIDNLGVFNKESDDWMPLYKQGYFVDWRVLDAYKVGLFDSIDFLLDTNCHEEPKMVPYTAILETYDIAVSQPFSVVPFFDPGPWGGQWMKEHLKLPENNSNYAWCFNCVPEENSLLIQINEWTIELPSINVVLRNPKQLLGESVFNQFGAEFPIRFDYLDTIKGGNLSLQVHPTKDYIKAHFNMDYTQDESYYIMDADEEAYVYLGFKENIDPKQCIRALKDAQKNSDDFNADAFVEKWPAKKHDHFLIPAGTIHCSGEGCMVLEISATPYIFTFKLWDWGRLGLDGKPRPINIEHGEKVLDWSRTSGWTKQHLVNQVEYVSQGIGWSEEKTGLHNLQFIETRRHWFTESVTHQTNGTVHVLAVVEGEEVIVESPSSAFEPFITHYGEVFIIPAAIDTYTITPSSKTSKKHGTLQAFVRSN